MDRIILSCCPAAFDPAASCEVAEAAAETSLNSLYVVAHGRILQMSWIKADEAKISKWQQTNNAQDSKLTSNTFYFFHSKFCWHLKKKFSI